MSRAISVLYAISGIDKFKKSLDSTKRASKFSRNLFSEIRGLKEEKVKEIEAQESELRKAEKIQTILIFFWTIVSTYSAVLIVRSITLYIRFSYTDIFIIYAPLISFISIVSTLKAIKTRKVIRATRIEEEVKCQN